MNSYFNQNMLSVICGILAKLNTHKVNIETKIERKKERKVCFGLKERFCYSFFNFQLNG